MNNFMNQGMNSPSKGNDQDEFYLIFKYKDKELFFDLLPNTTFKDALNGLINKYENIKQLNIKGLIYNQKLINPSDTPSALGIPNKSIIQIIA